MTVFANGLEISSKKQGCKVIAAFPDTCFTPPQTPATPPGVPIPYPDFGKDSDLTSGTGTVKIGGEPVSQENSSKYSKCSGDEAGSAPKKGIITSKNTGAVYAQKWSMDVKFEGKGVVRFSDMATSNHSSNPGDSPPMVVTGGANLSMAECAKILLELGMVVHPYNQASKHCSSSQQSDHILQNACFQNSRGGQAISTMPDYKIGRAPCVCLDDKTTRGTEHGEKTAAQNAWTSTQKATGKNPTYAEVREANLDAMKKAKAPAMDDGPDGKEHPAIGCLRMICDQHYKPLVAGDDDSAKEQTQCRCPRTGKFKQQASSTTVDLK
ncbi:DUF4150 domain-containing protein [Paracoccus methylarcula]|uniref:DUF4150 domain-containing protein n=1 Tax=Paracoccus methylarcula TaxID=72022 RepID=A0A422R1G5_9RHOB|nr:DUF4150 domain-containing protein [Paracoccus methylarcula]RNF35933.1 DUF4150 domain-containing protein [Paracoccus methylarcula]